MGNVTRPIVLRRAARAEFLDAGDWYEARRTGLGAAYKKAVQKVLDRIAEQPEFYPVVWEDVREALVPRFTYCVYYLPEETRIVVLAIMHTARDPAVWQSRI